MEYGVLSRRDVNLHEKSWMRCRAGFGTKGV